MIEFERELRRAKDLAKSEPDEALRICSQVMDEDMDGQYGQMALFMTGYIFMEAERYGLAYHVYKRCEQLNPNVSEIYSNMGMCLEDYSPKLAIESFRKAYQLNPKNSHALANEALIYLQTGKPEKCLELCNKALEIEPDLRSAQHNKGLALIMLRRWKEGWKLYHDTLGVKHREKRNYGLPDWNGEPGKVLVYGEQGVGDEIMFASCIPDLLRTNEVVLDCDSRLYDLFKRSFDCPVYGTRFHKEALWFEDEKPDYQCAIGQLPHYFRNAETEYPGTPYLKPCPEKSVMWRALFDTFKGRKVGVAWRGGLPNTGEKKRSLSLDDMSHMFSDADTYISLEYKPVKEDNNLKHYKETLKGGDIDDLAALISQLDYVITACTTVVYVAGALGVPCYVVVPDQPGYRYCKRGDFPWYDSVKLFRKKTTWKECLKRAFNAANNDWLRSSRNSGLSRTMSLDTISELDSGLIHAN